MGAAEAVPDRKMKRRYVVSIGVAVVVLPLWSWLSREPSLTMEARRIEDELREQLPLGSSRVAIESALRQQGWNLEYSPILRGYYHYIRRGRDGILVRLNVDDDGHLICLEVKAVYSSGLG
ncbi:hypothetical protein [Muricoccus nepalensis]|uniref:hypothetical protein n=1 Tax=Muricoccus nepalensis TaxID=1854500 RepID=UPI0013A57522|nr:hypothetical protein [Roseomonas nepalensis]